MLQTLLAGREAASLQLATSPIEGVAFHLKTRPPHKPLMRTSLLLSLLLVWLNAAAGSLDRLDQVDLIELEPKTGQAQLVVLLEDDRVNTRPAYRALFKKVNNYLDFVDSSQLKIAAPNASDAVRPKIVVYGPREATTGEMQNLAGLKLAGQKAGVEVEVLAYVPGIKARPVAIKPIKRASGA